MTNLTNNQKKNKTVCLDQIKTIFDINNQKNCKICEKFKFVRQEYVICLARVAKHQFSEHFTKIL